MLLKTFKIEYNSIRSARRILLFCHFHFFFFFFLCLNSKSLFQSCHWIGHWAEQGGDRWVRLHEESLEFHPRFFPVFEEKREN